MDQAIKISKMPPCRYGAQCHGLFSGNCPFSHPPPCHHGADCRKLKAGCCRFAHPPACLFGAACIKQGDGGCPYVHPKPAAAQPRQLVHVRVPGAEPAAAQPRQLVHVRVPGAEPAAAQPRQLVHVRVPRAEPAPAHGGVDRAGAVVAHGRGRGQGGAMVAVQYDDGQGYREHVQVRPVEQQLLFEATIDVSGSMKGDRMTMTVGALQDIFHGTMRSEDMFGLVMFDSEVTELHKIMRKREVDLEQDIAVLLAGDGGDTALYDAIAASVQSLRKQEPFVRRALHAKRVTVLHLVITDGEDNHSQKSAEDIKHMLQNPNVQGYHMHIIGVGLNSAAQRALAGICAAHDGKRATLHVVSDLAEFKRHVDLVRQALEIVLEVSDGGEEGRRVMRAVVNRHDFREVLEALSGQSRLAQAHLPALMAGMARLALSSH